MKTLLVTLEYPPFKGGVANYYGHLAKYWPLDENLGVLDNSRGELQRRAGFLSWLPSIGAISRRLKLGKYDYLLVGQVLPLGTAAWLLSFFRPLRYGVMLHGMDFSYALKTGWKFWLTSNILGRSQTIICGNSFVAEKVREYFPRYDEKIGVVNPGIVPEAPEGIAFQAASLRTRYGLDGKTVLLSLGRLVKRKGVDRTIEALVQFTDEELKNIRYIIAGDGPREQYLKGLVTPRLKDSILFLGEISEEEKWAWLGLCDIFIMPSRHISGDFEGFGIVYLEANLCSKPVIAGDSGGVRDAVEHERSGLLVDPERPDAIADAIRRLANDRKLRQRLGQLGKERAQKEFNWEKQAKLLSDLIKL